MSRNSRLVAKFKFLIKLIKLWVAVAFAYLCSSNARQGWDGHLSSLSSCHLQKILKQILFKMSWFRRGNLNKVFWWTVPTMFAIVGWKYMQSTCILAILCCCLSFEMYKLKKTALKSLSQNQVPKQSSVKFLLTCKLHELVEVLDRKYWISKFPGDHDEDDF